MNALILSAVFGMIMMFCSFLVRNRGSLRHIASVGLLILLIANIADSYTHTLFIINTYGMLAFSRFGYLFNSIAIGSTLIYVLITGKEIEKYGRYTAEYFTLIFFVLCGISMLSSYNNLLTLFLGIEIMSIPLYILTGSDKRNMKSNEAALKYFLMGSFSTGLMLMGIALTYGGTGTFSLEVTRGGVMPVYLNVASFLEIFGLLFLMVSMAFKVSAAPFHFWTPDVYDGAPSVFTSFMSTIVKAAGFIALIKLFDVRMQATEKAIDWNLLMSIIIVATLLVGNVTAVFQQSVKRMLAYSSIAQAGFMLFSLMSLNDTAHEGIIFYAAAYSIATIGIFAVLVKMKDYTFEGYNGLAKTQPVLAATNTIFLLSLAGIPLTAGFFAKYLMLAALIKTGTYLWLVVVGVLFAAVSVYYYFRVIQAMYFKEGNPETEIITHSFKWGLIFIAAIVILLGIFPTSILNWLYF
ncbi:NADH-quinone oxidoreductase subunit N [Panacibacter ginsenosidivorans]|uniref:NADH-quinone oxidoreductase subunit N n=1 Tax=Panacibacter ginsenosidivorans TaxID=1813871 RepID=A0A5B8VDG2_9BACT|nr:NADH-quinone oxidoreductase subunit N [Panacibacter ginsenosidivorans]QEC69011.1 NADH-quinone oxidoreductase subunit N [Panacibacter ginsenosidivorans]